jgi:hypothetical protein
MIDYKITRFHDGDIGIYVESDFAAMRGWEEIADGMIEVFDTPEDARRFVQTGEAQGYTFEGKSLLQPHFPRHDKHAHVRWRRYD